jgi:uncharacterized membrane protein
MDPRPTRLPTQRDINYLKIPLLLSAAAIGLFCLTLIPDVLDARGVIHLPGWVSVGGAEDARAILSATMGAVATVLALIFSVALLVISMIATLFGPRLLYRFLEDWVTQVTIGLFLGTFIFICLCLLVTREEPGSRFIPQVSLLTSWVLVVGCFTFLVFYSHRIATSIQNPDMIARVVDDLYPVIASLRHRSANEGIGQSPDEDAIRRRAATGTVVPCTKSGYLQQIDHSALVTAARSSDALIIFQARVGQFLLRGEPLASIVPGAKGERLEAAIQRSVRIGRHHRLTQDSEFGVAQIVEIALRALSAAVNDTFTGVACVDWLADALLALAEKPPREWCWFDLNGELRVWVPSVRLERLTKLAFDQIRQAAATTPAVLIRQLDIIRRLAPRMPDPVRRVLAAQANAIRETPLHLVSLDQRDLDAAYGRAQAALAGGVSAPVTEQSW